jgi:hypothetical protein
VPDGELSLGPRLRDDPGMSDQPTPLETALDLIVYVPVGLALTLGEEIPKLAAKGRARLGGQITMARMVGKFTVTQGRREVDRRVNGSKAAPAAPPRPAPARTAPGPTASPSPASASPRPDPATAPPSPAVVPAPAPSAARRSTPARPSPATDAPDVATLAIPGYASLSASQVVQRLAGLSGDELEAVRLFEAANRGRRTILARVGQLQTR